MTREIKFKAKRLDNGEWVIGDLITDGKESKNDFAHIFPSEADTYDFDQMVMVDKKTICQYTGLKDKNGKEIFEGDRTHAGNLNCTIVWSHGKWCAQWSNDKVVDARPDITFRQHEVIGNIHDTKGGDND